MKFYRRERQKSKGAALVEYVVLLSGMSLVAVATVVGVGKDVNETFDTATLALASPDEFSVVGSAGSATGAIGGSEAGSGSEGSGGSGGSATTTGTGTGTGADYCPPSNWTWNPDRNTYTIPGPGLYHKDSRHGARILTFFPPETTTEVGVPASQDGDVFAAYAYNDPVYTSRHYWDYTGHISAGDLFPPGVNC